MSTYPMPKSQRGARRQYNTLMRRYRRDFGSPGDFGHDWPTLRANAPELYAHLHAVNAVFASLPK